MPRDVIPTPLTTARFPASTLRYASARRAEFFSILNRMKIIRKHGPKPLERELRAMDEASLKAAGKFASKVLP